MTDPDLQAVWHELNQAQVSLIEASSMPAPGRLLLLTEVQNRAKKADVLVKQILAARPGQPKQLSHEKS